MENQNDLKTNSYLSFKLGEESFASNVSKVLNILEMMKITSVPKSPDYMKGVINLRGTVLPVIDTRLKFGMSPIEETTNTCILVLDVTVNDKDVKVGAMVDSVQEVLELDDKDIQSPPSIGSKYKTEFIYGMAKSGEDFIMLIDMDHVFSVDEVINLNSKLPSEKEKY